jgi:hypothetical protein
LLNEFTAVPKRTKSKAESSVFDHQPLSVTVFPAARRRCARNCGIVFGEVAEHEQRLLPEEGSLPAPADLLAISSHLTRPSRSKSPRTASNLTEIVEYAGRERAALQRAAQAHQGVGTPELFEISSSV